MAELSKDQKTQKSAGDSPDVHILRSRPNLTIQAWWDTPKSTTDAQGELWFNIRSVKENESGSLVKNQIRLSPVEAQQLTVIIGR